MVPPGQPIPAEAALIVLPGSKATIADMRAMVAQVVEAGIENGAVRVYRVTCSVDCGQVVNPRIVEDQIEGGILFGLTAALYGEITLQDGEALELWGVVTDNLHSLRRR